ncbi:MAG: RluA family pseudouridine synthase [bacterium JZ-2024 1]
MRALSSPSGVYRVTRAEAGRTLFSLIRKLFPDVPLSRLSRALRTGEIRVNQSKASRNYTICEGDSISYPEFIRGNPPSQRETKPATRETYASERTAKSRRVRGICVIYEDEDFLAVNKPSGLPVHGGSGIFGATLTHWIRDRFSIPDSTYQPSPVHRIDRPASGIVVFAKTLRAHQYLARLFAEKSASEPTSHAETVPLTKIYLALVRGKPPAREGIIDLPLGEKKVTRPDEPRKVAVSRYRVLSTSPPMCFLELMPVHGRTHQLRMHLSHAGIPILGDRRYGGAFPGIYRPMLHLWRLTFPAPGGKMLSLVAELPADFLKAMARFGFEPPPESALPAGAAQSGRPRGRRRFRGK